MRTAYQKIRLESGVENYWKNGLCATHYIHHLAGEVRCKDGVMRQMPQKTLARKLKLISPEEMILYKQLRGSSPPAVTGMVVTPAAPSTGTLTGFGAASTGTLAVGMQPAEPITVSAATAAQFAQFQQMQLMQQQQQQVQMFATQTQMAPAAAPTVLAAQQSPNDRLLDQIKLAQMRHLNP